MKINQPKPLTARQREILNFIRAGMRKMQFPPTVREIGAAFGITSPNGVMCHLKALEKKGWIRRRPRQTATSFS